MDKKITIDTHAEYINKEFDKAFQKRILNGRTKMQADVTPRTYPYTDLIKMYSSGVMVGMDITMKELDK